MISEAEGNC